MNKLACGESLIIYIHLINIVLINVPLMNKLACGKTFYNMRIKFLFSY